MPSHKWVISKSRRWQYCRLCGIVSRADGKNKVVRLTNAWDASERERIELRKDKDTLESCIVVLRAELAAAREALEVLKSCPPLHTDAPEWIRFYTLAKAVITKAEAAKEGKK